MKATHDSLLVHHQNQTIILKSLQIFKSFDKQKQVNLLRLGKKIKFEGLQ